MAPDPDRLVVGQHPSSHCGLVATLPAACSLPLWYCQWAWFSGYGTQAWNMWPVRIHCWVLQPCCLADLLDKQDMIIMTVLANGIGPSHTQNTHTRANQLIDLHVWGMMCNDVCKGFRTDTFWNGSQQVSINTSDTLFCECYTPLDRRILIFHTQKQRINMVYVGVCQHTRALLTQKCEGLLTFCPCYC